MARIIRNIGTALTENRSHDTYAPARSKIQRAHGRESCARDTVAPPDDLKVSVDAGGQLDPLRGFWSPCFLSNKLYRRMACSKRMRF